MQKVSETENTVTVQMDKIHFEALMLVIYRTTPNDFASMISETYQPSRYPLLRKLLGTDWGPCGFIDELADKLRIVQESIVSYREPTLDDVGKTIEVRDTEHEHWTPRLLVGVLPCRFTYRYVVQSNNCTKSSINFRFARIKD
jgi:hypothetical protein